MKTNIEVAAAAAAGKYAAGLHFTSYSGGDVWSYRTQIAQVCDKYALVHAYNFSATTSHHISYLLRELRPARRVLRVPVVNPVTADEHERNISHLQGVIDFFNNKVKRARKDITRECYERYAQTAACNLDYYKRYVIC